MRTRCSSHYLPIVLLFLALLPVANSYATGETTRVSVDSFGVEGNFGSSYGSSFSADGRYVAFSSASDNLAPGDINGQSDVFVHDRLTSTTNRVSVNSAGIGTQFAPSFNPSISADGRYVAFTSTAFDLVPDKTTGWQDIFVHDRLTGATTRVSVNSNGRQTDFYSDHPAVSADGRYVAFNSRASNLVPGDTNGENDTFVHDRLTGKTTRVSVDSAGLESNNGSDGNSHPSISADGRYVTFSSADHLVPGDTDVFEDVYVHDQVTGTTSLVSLSAAVGGGFGRFDGAISADGRYVAFTSISSSLVPEDTKLRAHIFVHNRTTGATTLVSVDPEGKLVKGQNLVSAISADGRFVAFTSTSPDPVTGDHNRSRDAFVHDQLTRTSTRVSVDSAGLESALDVVDYGSVAINADGRYVAFSSAADNFVPGDTNAAEDTFVRDRLLKTSQNADLQLTVTTQPDSVQIGDVGRYVFTITNNGPDSASSVNLIDFVSAGKVWSLTPSQGGCRISAVSVCRLGSLAAGESATVRAVFKAKANPLTQQVSVSAAPLDNVPDNNSLIVSTPVTP